MTSIFFKTTMACIAISTFAFANTAQANNSFNKFPVEKSEQSSQNLHESAYVRKDIIVKRTTQQNTRMIKIVKPIPSALVGNIAFVSEKGSENKTDGFNKMSKHEDKGIDMPTFIDKKAMSAR